VLHLGCLQDRSANTGGDKIEALRCSWKMIGWEQGAGRASKKSGDGVAFIIINVQNIHGAHWGRGNALTEEIE